MFCQRCHLYVAAILLWLLLLLLSSANWQKLTKRKRKTSWNDNFYPHITQQNATQRDTDYLCTYWLISDVRVWVYCELLKMYRPNIVILSWIFISLLLSVFPLSFNVASVASIASVRLSGRIKSRSLSLIHATMTTFFRHIIIIIIWPLWCMANFIRTSLIYVRFKI